MPYCTTNALPSTEIFYEDTGGNGRPVVLIHGWPLSGRMWESQIHALMDAGYRCISYDRRGFGASGKPTGGFDYDTFAADLSALMEHLDLKNTVLVGFSMGGGEVCRFISRYGTDRVAGAMLIGAVPPYLLKTDDNPNGVPREVFEGMLAGLRKDRINFLGGFFQAFFNLDRTPESLTPEALQFNKSIAWQASPLATLGCVHAFSFTDFREDLKKMTLPVAVIHGDADQIVPLEVSGALSAKLLKKWPSRGHSWSPSRVRRNASSATERSDAAFPGGVAVTGRPVTPHKLSSMDHERVIRIFAPRDLKPDAEYRCRWYRTRSR